jgi:carbonic anhydrase
MDLLPDIFHNNKSWAEKIRKEDPSFFERLAKQQKPRVLWIGCSDSRVPANQICGLDPGEIFVHRNVGNVVTHTDVNCLSVLQFAVDVLQVKHVILCGHYGCGGVNAAIDGRPLGLIDNWLRHIKDVYYQHRKTFEKIEKISDKQDKLAELNVRASVLNLCHTTIVQDCWKRGQELHVHGWIYAITDGLLKDLKLSLDGPEQLHQIYVMTE